MPSPSLSDMDKKQKIPNESDHEREQDSRRPVPQLPYNPSPAYDSHPLTPQPASVPQYISSSSSTNPYSVNIPPSRPSPFGPSFNSNISPSSSTYSKSEAKAAEKAAEKALKSQMKTAEKEAKAAEKEAKHEAKAAEKESKGYASEIKHQAKEFQKELKHQTNELKKELQHQTKEAVKTIKNSPVFSHASYSSGSSSSSPPAVTSRSMGTNGVYAPPSMPPPPLQHQQYAPQQPHQQYAPQQPHQQYAPQQPHQQYAQSGVSPRPMMYGPPAPAVSQPAPTTTVLLSSHDLRHQQRRDRRDVRRMDREYRREYRRGIPGANIPIIGIAPRIVGAVVGDVARAVSRGGSSQMYVQQQPQRPTTIVSPLPLSQPVYSPQQPQQMQQQYYSPPTMPPQQPMNPAAVSRSGNSEKNIAQDPLLVYAMSGMSLSPAASFSSAPPSAPPAPLASAPPANVDDEPDNSLPPPPYEPSSTSTLA